MENTQIIIDTSRIPACRGKAIGRAFYNAFKAYERDREEKERRERSGDDGTDRP